MSSRTTDVGPDDEFIDDVEEEEPSEFEEDAEDSDDTDWDADVDDDDEDEGEDEDDGEEDDSDDAEALDELEAEELEMLTDDEASETLIVNEEQELRAIRRAELSLDEEGTERLADEFQCQSCFLVLKTTQLADKRRKHCKDCAG